MLVRTDWKKGQRKALEYGPTWLTRLRALKGGRLDRRGLSGSKLAVRRLAKKPRALSTRGGDRQVAEIALRLLRGGGGSGSRTASRASHPPPCQEGDRREERCGLSEGANDDRQGLRRPELLQRSRKGHIRKGQQESLISIQATSRFWRASAGRSKIQRGTQEVT